MFVQFMKLNVTYLEIAVYSACRFYCLLRCACPSFFLFMLGIIIALDNSIVISGWPQLEIL